MTGSKQRAITAARAASAKKATDIVVLEVGPIIDITDYFVICSGANDPQVGAIVEEVAARLRDEGVKPSRVEGERERRWVLLDYLDVVVHVFNAEEREFYELERLWKDARRLEFEEDPQSAAGSA